MADLVQAPARQPRVGGIKDVAPAIVEVTRAGTFQGLVWEDSACSARPAATRAGCFDPADPDADPKEGSGVDQFTTIGEPFARFAGVTCWIGGDEDGSSYAEQARAALEGWEDREVEEALVAWAEAAVDTAAAASLAAAIGALENDVDVDYIGRPVLVMSRVDSAAAFAAGALVRADGHLVSGNGTPVLATGKATIGTVSMIGQPVVYASPVTEIEATHHTSNVTLALAERIYALGVDCDYRATATVEP